MAEINQEKSVISTAETIPAKPAIDSAIVVKMNQKMNSDLAVAEEATERTDEEQKMEALLNQLEVSEK